MGYSDDIVHLAAQVAQGQAPPNGIEGLIQPGSYNPADGTVSVRVGGTIGLPAGDFDQELVIPSVRVNTPGIGIQAGPTGDERVILHPIEGGFTCTYVHDLDDSPGANAGEIVQVQRLDSSTFTKLLTGGINSIGASTQANIIAPQVALGYDQPDTSNDGVVRYEDLNNNTIAIINAVQAAFNQLCTQIQSGQGVPPPQVQTPTPTASETVFAKE
jgi:hypothetical protein